MESRGGISEATSNSMVTVVETNVENYEDHCAGCVIFNSVHNTFVLTSSFLVNANSKLTVYFSDKTSRTSKIVSLGKKFCILGVRLVESATAVCFREEEVARESAIILAPVDAYDSPTLCSAFVVAPTCKGKDHKLVPVRRSEDFFLVKCCFQDRGYHCRSRLNSAPVFDKEGNGIGIVYADLYRSGANVKRIIRARCVGDRLNKLMGSVNWEEVLQGLDPVEEGAEPPLP